MNGYDMNSWGWVAMVLMVVAIAIVGLVAWVIARRPELRDASARKQLDARLASGAISTEEYHNRLDVLSG